MSAPPPLDSKHGPYQKATTPLRHPFRVLASVLVCGSLAGVAQGCGSQNAEIRPSSPFTEEMAVIFDDGADFVGDPDVLEGRWRQGWSEDLQARVGGADLIAGIKVRTIRTDTDLNRRQTHRLVIHFEEVYQGRKPSGELTLLVSDDQPGYSTVDGNDRQLLRGTFMLYLKWVQAQDGTLGSHWHLSPGTDPVIRYTRLAIRGATDFKPRSYTVVQPTE